MAPCGHNEGAGRVQLISGTSMTRRICLKRCRQIFVKKFGKKKINATDSLSHKVPSKVRQKENKKKTPGFTEFYLVLPSFMQVMSAFLFSLDSE